jgi:hypothetical protein
MHRIPSWVTSHAHIEQHNQKMKKLITPIVVVLCPMLVLAGCATNNIAPIASNGGILANEPGVLDNRTKVIRRLGEVGYSKEEAIARVDEMTDAEIAYFGQHPESIKRSGFIILASLIGSSVWTTINNAKQKRVAYIAHLRDKIAGFRTEITLTDSKRMNERTLLAVEQNPARRAELEVEIKRLGDEIDSKQDQIKSLENDVREIETKGKKVPNKKDW